jgi:undecaprenyl-diphosphatase
MTTMHLAETYLGDAGDFLLVNRFARRTGWLHPIMTAYAGTVGIAVLVVLLAVGWWLARRSGDARTMAALVWTGLGTLIAVAVNQPLVSAAAERRPYQSLPHVLVLISRSTDFSFPSDHATMAGAVATGLCFVNRRLGIVAWLAAALLAFARVYVGAHYPHDVAVGLLVGSAVILIGGLVARPALTWATERLASTRVRPLLVASRT